jgi:pimeloyl-ACP methyl ester carboxylesterase
VHPPELEGITHRYYDLETGIRTHVAEAGPPDGPPLVALHGFPQHWYEWRRVIPLLAEHRILALDTRGLGWSSKAPDGDYRKATIAEDVIALLDDLGIERAGLLAHDWGAWVGWHLVLDHAHRFTSYVATGIVHPFNPLPKLLREAPRFLYQPPIAAPILGPRLIPHVVTRFIRGGWGDTETYDRAAEPIYAEPYRSCADAASHYYRQFLARELFRGPSGRLTVPTRLLQGRKDPIGTALARGLERHGDDARTILLDGCGHFVPEERPAEVARAVLEVYAPTAASSTA